jgi:hypothetical protein
MKRKFDIAEIVFNNPDESDGFEYGVSIINKFLKSYNLKINIKENIIHAKFAWEIKVENV